MNVKVTEDKIVKAKYSEAFSFSIFGNPKMTVICSHCNKTFSTREYRPDTKTREAMAHCPHCDYWNGTALQVLR